jgi:hypothetical protein
MSAATGNVLPCSCCDIAVTWKIWKWQAIAGKKCAPGFKVLYHLQRHFWKKLLAQFYEEVAELNKHALPVDSKMDGSYLWQMVIFHHTPLNNQRVIGVITLLLLGMHHQISRVCQVLSTHSWLASQWCWMVLGLQAFRRYSLISHIQNTQAWVWKIMLLKRTPALMIVMFLGL